MCWLGDNILRALYCNSLFKTSKEADWSVRVARCLNVVKEGSICGRSWEVRVVRDCIW